VSALEIDFFERLVGLRACGREIRRCGDNAQDATACGNQPIVCLGCGRMGDVNAVNGFGICCTGDNPAGLGMGWIPLACQDHCDGDIGVEGNGV